MICNADSELPSKEMSREGQVVTYVSSTIWLVSPKVMNIK